MDDPEGNVGEGGAKPLTAAEQIRKEIRALTDEGIELSAKPLTKWLRPSLREEVSLAYQAWYTRALSIMDQLLRDRYSEFCSLYQGSKGKITPENYSISDYLMDVTAPGSFFKPALIFQRRMRQQVWILRSAEDRLEGALVNIRSLVQADVFKSELEAAAELAKNGFVKPAGILCGVVLERHLYQVLEASGLPIKGNPSLGDLNKKLRTAGVIEPDTSKFLDSLALIRNQCAHGNEPDPTKQQFEHLLTGTRRALRTIRIPSLRATTQGRAPRTVSRRAPAGHSRKAPDK